MIGIGIILWSLSLIGLIENFSFVHVFLFTLGYTILNVSAKLNLN
jgi:hypothetical protein